MGLYSMRSGKDAFMLRIANAAYNCGATPNILTAFGLAFGIASGASIALGSFLYAIAFGLCSVFCDVLDGTLARRFHLESKFGLLFDSTADRVSEFSVTMGALLAGVIQPLGLIAVAGSVSLLGMRGVSYHKGFRTDYVLFGRFERLALILSGLVLPLPWLSTTCFVLAGVLALISSAQIALTLHKGLKRK